MALRLNIPFVDIDEVIEVREMRSIRTIFAEYGEASFREIESGCLAEAIAKPSVVSTGGGAVLSVANRRQLKAHAHVTYLCAQPHQLIQRIRRDGSRPLLNTADPLKTLEDLFAVRDPLYREVADLVIDVHSGSAAKTADRVIAAWQAAGWVVPQSGDEPNHLR